MEPPAPFREVHKHAWLKRLPDSRQLSGQKKGTPERWWTVFCIHGDAEPFLEGYQDGAAAGAHVPRWRTHLARTTSVSGSIRHMQSGDYEFVVALQEGAVRLAAPTRDAMQDWVETLRSKLREMKILGPRENLYSRAPEPRAGRAPTRDPTSPLPLPPGPLPRVPGTEMVPSTCGTIRSNVTVDASGEESARNAVDNTVTNEPTAEIFNFNRSPNVSDINNSFATEIDTIGVNNVDITTVSGVVSSFGTDVITNVGRNSSTTEVVNSNLIDTSRSSNLVQINKRVSEINPNTSSNSSHSSPSTSNAMPTLSTNDNGSVSNDLVELHRPGFSKKNIKTDGIHHLLQAETGKTISKPLLPHHKISNTGSADTSINKNTASIHDTSSNTLNLEQNIMCNSNDSFDAYVVLKKDERPSCDASKKISQNKIRSENDCNDLLSDNSVIVFSNTEQGCSSNSKAEGISNLDLLDDIPNRRISSESVKNSLKMSDKNLMDVLNSDIVLPQVKLSEEDDVWSCDSENVIEASRDFSKSTSTVAKISGMNVCLGESVLHRDDTSGNEEFYRRFYDGEADVESEKNISMLPSQMSISKLEAFKRSLLEPSPKSQIQMNSEKFNKEFPVAAPRSVVRVGGGAHKDNASTSSNDNYISNNSEAVIKPIATDRKKIHPVQTNLIQDTKNRASKENSVEFPADKSQSSNVTVISVSNLGQSSLLTKNNESQNCDKKKPVADNQDHSIIIDSGSRSNVSISSSTKSYVNVNIEPSNHVIQIQDNFKSQNDVISDETSKCNCKVDNVVVDAFSPVSSLNLSVGDGYGHIRHTTTVESKYAKESQINLSTVSQQGVSNVSILNVSGKHRHKSDSTGAIEQSSLMHSNVSASSNDMSATSDEVYESVFTPFTVSKCNIARNDSLKCVKEDLLNDVKVVLKVPELSKPSGSNLLSPRSKRKGNDMQSIMQESSSNGEQTILKPESFLNKEHVVIVSNPIVRKGLQSKINIINCTNAKIGDDLKLSTRVTKKNDLSNTPKPGKSSSDYEYLSWIRTDRGESSSQSNSSTKRSNDIVNDNSIIETNQNTPATSQSQAPNVETNHNDINQSRNTENSNDSEVRPTRHGLFTRGLTEFSIVTKFKNLGHTRQPLLKNTQFYDDSSNSNEKSSLEVKKNGGFSTKFNIFNKLVDSKGRDGGGPSKVVSREVQALRESSLRRNWSEHNDRTAPMPVVRSPESKAPRSRSDNNAVQDTARRRSSSLSSPAISIDENSSGIADTTSHPLALSTSPPLGADQTPRPLREQQAARLRRECSHAGGVRLRLRAADCPGEALALADAYGAVWVAGWRQKQHPLLYNALHIGDRLAAVNGCAVTSARQASRALKSGSTPRVELVLKRVPHAAIFVMRRNSDTDDLGLVLEGACVVAVTPGSPAAQAGVQAGGTLTEVNGRPLNLLLKKGDSQVRDRLNALGQDVSVLLQPTAFVALLRASLKNMRSHKEYIVQ